MQVGSEKESISFDLRPSDAINMAVRCKVHTSSQKAQSSWCVVSQTVMIQVCRFKKCLTVANTSLDEAWFSLRTIRVSKF